MKTHFPQKDAARLGSYLQCSEALALKQVSTSEILILYNYSNIYSKLWWHILTFTLLEDDKPDFLPDLTVGTWEAAVKQKAMLLLISLQGFHSMKDPPADLDTLLSISQRCPVNDQDRYAEVATDQEL